MSDIEQLRKELLQATEKEIEVEKVVQLCRIADSLKAIEEEGVYTWPQDTTEQEGRKEAEPRRQG